MNNMSSAKKNAKKLGMSFGAANNLLKKNLLFLFVKKLNLDMCYRCGEKIVDITRFSIEHKKGWRFAKNPRETFFDLNNIAFSHLDCNSRIGGGLNKIYKNKKEAQKAARVRMMERRGPELKAYWKAYKTRKKALMQQSMPG